MRTKPWSRIHVVTQRGISFASLQVQDKYYSAVTAMPALYFAIKLVKRLIGAATSV